jgi:hypothetical protein
MKKVISVNLEQDLINFIDTFQESKNLSSRSEALSRILLYHQFMHENIAIDSIKDTSKVPEVKPKIKKDDPTKDSILDIYNQIGSKKNSQ